jgi:hypothetical protein
VLYEVMIVTVKTLSTSYNNEIMAIKMWFLKSVMDYILDENDDIENYWQIFNLNYEWLLNGDQMIG